MKFQTITNADLDLWTRMQTDSVMMEHLGGPQPKERMPQIFKNTMKVVEDNSGWIYKVIDDSVKPEVVVGSVVLWETEHEGKPTVEMGWMILPEFQGQGWGKRSVRAVLDKVKAEGRWDVIHAYPAVSNAASNGICRSTGFTLLGEREFDYLGRKLVCNDWQIDLRSER